jgi:endonuclease III
MASPESLIKDFGKTYSSSLGIDLKSGKEEEIFKWFLASILFGKRISAEIAAKTYKEFEAKGILSAEKILETGWDGLVAILDTGGYVRYDFSTATKLLELAKKLNESYGALTEMHHHEKDSGDLEKRLMAFKGIGPVTTNIFLRELRTVWPKSDPAPGDLVKQAARGAKINLDHFIRKSDKFIKLEAALIRIHRMYKGTKNK